MIYRHLAGVPGEFGLDLPSRARQSLWWSRGLWLERDLPRKRVTRAGARLPGEGRERGTSLVRRHAGACAAVQKLSRPLEWLRSRPSRRVEGRTTVSDGEPQLRAALPSRREASALGAEPQRAPSHTPHAASGGSGIASETPRPARGFRERSSEERGTFLVSRHAGACAAVQKLSPPLEWLRSCPSRRVDKRGEVNDLPSRPTCQACRPFGAPPRRRVPLGSSQYARGRRSPGSRRWRHEKAT